MKRRTFFRIMLLGIAGVLAGYLALDFRRVVKMMLMKDVENLSFREPGTVEKFLSDADRERFWNQFSFAKKIFICLQHYFHAAGIRVPYHSKYLQYRSTITGHLLLSTDLFQNYGDWKKPVAYLGFFNPYKAPCANPFSDLRTQGVALRGERMLGVDDHDEGDYPTN